MYSDRRGIEQTGYHNESFPKSTKIKIGQSGKSHADEIEKSRIYAKTNSPVYPELAIEISISATFLVSIVQLTPLIR